MIRDILFKFLVLITEIGAFIFLRDALILLELEITAVSKGGRK